MSDSKINLIGKAVDRVDGRAKVTGKADYTSDYAPAKLCWAYAVTSTFASASLTSIDTSVAEKMPGFVKVYTYTNRPKLFLPQKASASSANPGEKKLALDNADVQYEGQIIAFLLAETYEQARAAAGKIKVAYQAGEPIGDQSAAQIYSPSDVDGLSAHITTNQTDSNDVETAWSRSLSKVDSTYRTAMLHHHPMEPHSAVAVWDGDRLNCYTPTQWLMGSRDYLSEGLGVANDKIRVISHYLGGGFGCKGSSWMFLLLTAMAARDVGRPVKYVMEREDMFSNVGHRPQTTQRLALGANRDGTLSAIRHLSQTSVSTTTEFKEATGHRASYVLYDAPAIEIDHKFYGLNVGAPCQMRAPGESPGVFALESAIDELALTIKMDPLALRLRNLSDKQPFTGLHFSSKHLEECYRSAADRFGWSNRNAACRSTTSGDWWVGTGMATALYPANRTAATVKVRLMSDGSAEVISATHDLGTGTYTIMAQQAADDLQLPIDKVRVEIGDSSFPKAGVSGGSMSAGSVLPAIQKATQSALNNLGKLAVSDPRSPMNGVDYSALQAVSGGLQIKDQPTTNRSFQSILSSANRAFVEAMESAAPPSDEKSKEQQGIVLWHDFAYYSFGAYFVEVKVHQLTSEVRVSRVVTAMNIGQPLNLKTARSQVIGGAIFQIGAALTEHSILDPHSACWITRDLGTYHLPVCADVPQIDVIFAGPPDTQFNSVGARGVGEIGNTGLAAAIGNAVYHATGVRIRSLPITTDKLLMTQPS